MPAPKKKTNTKRINDAISRQTIAQGVTENRKAKMEKEKAALKYAKTVRSNAYRSEDPYGMAYNPNPVKKAAKKTAKAQQSYGESVRSGARARAAETRVRGPKSTRKPLA